MNFRNLGRYLNGWVVLGAFAVAGILLIASLISFGWGRTDQTGTVGFAPAYLTVIPAPTSTPFVPTPTPDPNQQTTPSPAPGSIYVGGYAQITGTGGDGLRLRAAPGLNAEPLFLGYDSEVFQVEDGPQQADGYTWWYLVALYDKSRAGWAAANFLGYIPSPDNTGSNN
jgi:hypothetical protein